jgi:hypothetical protein
MRPSSVALCLLAVTWFVTQASEAHAQILIWSLPKEDGAWVRFEGSYKQTQARPESNAGDEVFEWRNELTISSVGTEEAKFGDSKAPVPCRWIEFKTITKANDLDKQPGPGGVYIYKVLIPASKVVGKPLDDDGIPVTVIPIVKGYRKVSTRDVEVVSERALAVYPTVAPLTYYPDLKLDESGAGELQLPVSNDPIAVKLFKGSRVLQTNVSRSTNVAEQWLSDSLPFGLAKFQVNLTREEKGLTQSVDEFRRKSFVEVEMSAVAQGNEAKSELPDSN